MHPMRNLPCTCKILHPFHSQGIVLSPWFVCDPRFWRCRCCDRRCNCCCVKTSQKTTGTDAMPPGIQLRDLRKRFTARPGSRLLCGRRWCCVRCRGYRCRLDCSKHHVDAVAGVSVAVPRRTLLGLIGRCVGVGGDIFLAIVKSMFMSR